MTLYQQSGVRGSRGIGQVSLENLKSKCKEYNQKAIKIIRGDFLEAARELLCPNSTDRKSQNAPHTHILYLVRDPRGVMASRTKIAQKHMKANDFITLNRDKMLYDAHNICDKYKTNIKFLQSLNCGNDLPAFRLVRYEDVAYQPLAAAREIYSFLNLTLSENVIDWISKATTNDYRDQAHYAYSTTRNSKSTAEAWRKYIPYELALDVDTECTEALQLLGYKAVYDEQTYLNTSKRFVDTIDLEYAFKFKN